MPRHRLHQFQIGSENDPSYLVAADFFLSFSKPASLLILNAVRKREMTAGEISQGLGIKPEAVSAQSNALQREGILASRIRSEQMLYRVADRRILKAFDRVLESPVKTLQQNGSPKGAHSGSVQKAGSVQKRFL
jgi:DNA-binding transcriptional ArsR family regulator